MKNLKKILSLTLALAMALSLMTTALAKDTGDFADGDDVSYAEAVDVMATIGVFNGTGDGSNFDPNGNLTREQAAKIITYMVMGQSQADQLVATIAPFADVSADRWSAGAIAYCASEGIMNGTGSGKFNPTGELTGLQFAKMLLVALGYDADIEEMTGTAWGLATSKLAYDVKLNDGLDNVNLTAVLTREQAAQMALTAMKTPLVRYPDKGSTISVNGAVVSFGAREAEYVTSEIAKEQTISNQRLSNTKYYTIEFGEKYCPKLVLTYGNDAFGRPSYTWSYDKKKINSYLDYSDFVGEFTKKVTGRDLYDLIGSTVLKDGDVEIYIDGETEKGVLNTYGYFTKDNIIRSNTEGVGATGNGTLTQVFVDTSGERNKITIAIINTYLAKADADFNEKKNEATFDVWSIDKSGSTDKLVKNATKVNPTTGQFETIKVSGEDFDDLENVKKDDIFLVTVADETIQEFAAPEVVEGTTINAFKNGEWLKADGTQYDYASTAQYDVEVLDDYSQTNMKDTTYNVYLDPYGYAIGVEIVEKETNYVFLTGIDLGTSNLTNKTAEGNIIFLDGTIETVKINMDKSRNAQDKKFTAGDDDPADDGTGVSSLMNTWCTYTVDKNGVYTLTEVPNHDGNFDAGDKAGQSRNFGYGKKANGATPNGSPANGSEEWDDTKANYNDGTLDADQKKANREVVTIDKKHVTLNGIASSDIVSKAYANDASIFLSAKTDLITATNTPNSSNAKAPAVVISGISGISTGIRNTSLTAYTAQGVIGEGSDSYKNHETIKLYDVSNGVYTLFSNKGYVIAAIVVGEDGGASSNYVYVTSDKASQEGYSSADDEWTWTREVILNGQKAEITEKGDKLSEIGHKGGEGNMTRGGKTYGADTGDWYKVTYKADGTVHEVEALTFAAKGNSGKYIKDITDVEASVDDEDTVILFANYTGQTNIVTVQGNTLQVAAKGNQAEHEGFAVAPDAKIALIQDTAPTINSLKIMDKIYEYDNGTDGLARAVKDMNDNENFKGYISAVFENGLATSIVIYDKTGTKVDQGSEGDDEGTHVREYPRGTLDVTSTNRLTALDVADAIRDFLNDDRIVDVDYDATTGVAIVKYENGRSVRYNVTVNDSVTSSALEAAEVMTEVQAIVEKGKKPNGTITIEGNKMTATGDSADYVDPAKGTNGTSQATEDFVNFVVALNEAGVEEIEFLGDTYEWNDEVTYASRWVKPGATLGPDNRPTTDTDTLVTSVVNEVTRQASGTMVAGKVATITLTVDGNDMVFVIAIPSAS